MSTLRLFRAVFTWTVVTLLTCALWACASSSTEENKSSASASSAIANVPYQLQLKNIAGDKFPGIHSMVYTAYQGKVIFLGGRLNGLHGFPGQNKALSNPSFPKDQKNTHVFIVDQATGALSASASVMNLPANVVQQLTATNTQFEVVDEILYIVGGYGYNDTGQMLTLQQAMAIPLADLVKAVEQNALNAEFAKTSIFVGSHPALAITGGDLQPAKLINETGFLLIFGHRFDGVYSTGGGTATQEYSESVRKFEFAIGSTGKILGKPIGALKVTYEWIEPPISRTRPPEATKEYHRRDLSVLPLLSPSGVPYIAALGGVFVPGQMAGFLNPVNIKPVGASDIAAKVLLEVDRDTTQLMAQYKAGSVPIYSKSQQSMYLSIFAGISQYYWQDGKLKHDTPNFNISPPIDGLPFINTVSTLKMTNTDSQQYLHVDQYFPPTGAAPTCGSEAVAANYLGAETVFIPAQGDFYVDGVIQLDTIKSSTVVGYLAGGIASTAPYPASDGTCASPTYYEVTLNPAQPTTSVLLTLP